MENQDKEVLENIHKQNVNLTKQLSIKDLIGSYLSVDYKFSLPSLLSESFLDKKAIEVIKSTYDQRDVDNSSEDVEKSNFTGTSLAPF